MYKYVSVRGYTAIWDFLLWRMMANMAEISTTLQKGPLNFEIHNLFANAFESTLPLPKGHEFNSRWLFPALARAAVAIWLGSVH